MPSHNTQPPHSTTTHNTPFTPHSHPQVNAMTTAASVADLEAGGGDTLHEEPAFTSVYLGRAWQV